MSDMIERRYLNTLKVPLRWMDIDLYGHLGNAQYYNLMTDLRVDFFGGKAFMKDIREHQFVVRESHCSYEKPSYYPDTMLIHQYCDYVKNSSCGLSYDFFMESEPTLLHAAGSVVMVYFDVNLKSAVRIPEEIRLHLLGEKS